MKADAIIFDKDGTLIDFDAFWVTVSVKAVEEVLLWAGKCDCPASEALLAFGVRDGVTDIEGTLCKGTYEELGHIMYDVLSRHGCERSREDVTDALIKAYKKHADSGEVLPTSSELATILGELKARNKKLAVVTTDNMEITLRCLDALGITHLLDKIYTDDGKTPTKPDPYCVYDFCRLMNVERERVVMVGDTMTDINFAKNAGISMIGIAKCEGNKRILSRQADAVISDPSHLLEVLE